MAKGSCLCGKINFKIGGDMSDMTHCHCSMCRKIHGSQFATYMTVTECEYTSGAELVQSYVSSEGFERAFCKECGAVLPASKKDSKYYIPAGILDDDPGIRPEAHIFTESKAAAYTIHDDLPRMTHYGDGELTRVVEVPVPEKGDGVVKGGCLCGDVAFEYSEAPKFMMNCHCTRCRKVKGAAHATNAFVPIGNFRWTKGEDRTVNFALPEAERFGNAFCANCGSSVPRESSGSGMLNVPVGGLDSDPGVVAKGHIFIGSKAPWFEVKDDLPQWDEMPTK
jgi:hypothetical protein